MGEDKLLTSQLYKKNSKIAMVFEYFLKMILPSCSFRERNPPFSPNTIVKKVEFSLILCKKPAPASGM